MGSVGLFGSSTLGLSLGVGLSFFGFSLFVGGSLGSSFGDVLGSSLGLGLGSSLGVTDGVLGSSFGLGKSFSL